MRSVATFELQRNVGKQLEELPFKITRYGKTIAMVNKYNVTLNNDNVTLNTSATKSLLNKINVVQQTKGLKLCDHGFPLGLCKIGCK